MNRPILSKDQIVMVVEQEEDYSSPVFAQQVAKVARAAEMNRMIHCVRAHRNRIDQRTILPDWITEFPVTVYGSHQFVRDIKEPIFPGAYGLANTDWISMANNYPRDGLFNHDYRLVSWGDLYDNFPIYVSEAHERMKLNRNPALFVRPVSGRKTFAGQVIRRDSHETEMQAIEKISSVTRDTICVIAAVKSKPKEDRFWIVNNEVVAYSAIPDTSNRRYAIETGSLELAKKIASLEWQPDSAYTVDITTSGYWGASLGNNLAQVVEINSFSCAGVYDCDLSALLPKLVDQTLRDYGP